MDEVQRHFRDRVSNGFGEERGVRSVVLVSPETGIFELFLVHAGTTRQAPQTLGLQVLLGDLGRLLIGDYEQHEG